MGNVVPSCTSPPGYPQEGRGAAAAAAMMFRGDDGDDHEHVGDEPLGKPRAACAISYQTRTEQEFFAKYQSSSDQASIASSSSSSLQLLDPGQVMNALLEQAEELLRRETTHQNLLDNLENLLREDDDDDDDDDGYSESSSGCSTSTSSSGAFSTNTPRSAASSSRLVNEVRDDDAYNIDNSNDEDNESRGDDIFSNLSDTDLDSRLDGGRSMATHTVFTTGTAATQPAKNVGKSKPRHGGGRNVEHNNTRLSSDVVRRPPAEPRLPGDAGTSFAATQRLQSQIHSALGTQARRALSRPYLRSAERFQESVRLDPNRGDQQRRRGSQPTVLPFPNQCGAALGNWKWLGSNLHCRDPRSQQQQSTTPKPHPQRPDGQNERVLRYMRAIYLQLPSRSASYVKRNPRLKRLLPDNPVSLAHPDPFRTASLLDHGYGDRDIRRLAESLGGGRSSADGVVAALSSSSSAVPPPMQLLTMSTSQHSGNVSNYVGLYGAEDGRDDDDDNEFESADFGTSADGPTSTPVRMWVTNQVFLDLAVTGSLGWVRQQHPRDRAESNPSSSSSRNSSSPNPYLALINRRSLVPLVVCTSNTESAAGRGPCGSLSVLVHATKRRHPDQRPALSTRQLHGGNDNSSSSSLGGATNTTAAGDSMSYDLPLYSWAKIVVEGNYPHRVTYAVHMAISDADNSSTGSDDSTSTTSYEPIAQYVAVHDSFRTPEVVVTGRTCRARGRGSNRRRDYAGCAVVSLCHFRRRRTAASDSCNLYGDDGRDDDDCDDMEGGGNNDVCTRVSVSTQGWGGGSGVSGRGRAAAAAADPALLLCLGAVVDEFIERSLRIQSRGLAEAVYRRSQRAL
jgi:hypothetical protein